MYLTSWQAILTRTNNIKGYPLQWTSSSKVILARTEFQSISKTVHFFTQSYPHYNKQSQEISKIVDLFTSKQNKQSQTTANIEDLFTSKQNKQSDNSQYRRPLYLQTEQTISDNSQYRRPLYLQTEQTISDNSQYRRPLRPQLSSPEQFWRISNAIDFSP
jgi:hypothetical protein